MKYKFKPLKKEELEKVRSVVSGTLIRVKEPAELESKEIRPILERYSSKGGEVKKAVIDIKKLRRALYELKLLKKLRQTVQVKILKEFERSSHDTLTAKELKEHIKGHSASSIQRALKSLVEQKLLKKPGRGTYRKNF